MRIHTPVMETVTVKISARLTRKRESRLINFLIVIFISAHPVCCDFFVETIMLI